jgi:sporulation protein YlmC with PRC-barrel domain
MSEMRIKAMMNQLYMTGALIGLSLFAGAQTGVKETPCVWLADDLIGMDVVSEQGESLGKVEDIVVHPGSDASYAVLSFGGWLGMGDKLFAMPWTVLRTVEGDQTKDDSMRSLVLPLTKEQLKTAPGFDKKTWPTMANPDWTRDVDAFYMNDVIPSSKRSVEAAVRTSIVTWRATELKGYNVETPTGEKLGDLKELAIDANGRVNYVVLSVGGFLGLGERLIAVPWDSLKFSHEGDKADKKLITLATTKERLEQAPQFKEGPENCAEMCDPKWISSVYSYYSCPAYWDTTVNLDVTRLPAN